MRRLLTLALTAAAVACFTSAAVAGNGNGSTPPGKAQATAPGVKPGNATQHDTSCQTNPGGCQPGSKPDSSKQYGNGKTAAQIATGRGAPSGTTVHGPGNSQPHKVTSCKHAHAVDVHAVKSYSADCSAGRAQAAKAAEAHAAKAAKAESKAQAAAQASAAANANVQAQAAQQAAAARPGVTPAAAQGNGRAPARATALGATHPSTGVLGATATRTRPSHSLPSHSALGRLASVATRPTLPFTGFPLWIAALVALGLIGGGLTARRAATARR